MSDLISRQRVNDLIDELARAISDERCCMSRGRSTATIMQDILELPSVTPRPERKPITVKGEWIEIKANPYLVICPFCKHTSLPKNFCGDCGADLRGEQK